MKCRGATPTYMYKYFTYIQISWVAMWLTSDHDWKESNSGMNRNLCGDRLID